MALIDASEPATPTTLAHLGDWAIWVTLLLSLARGSGVLDAQASRELLLDRFDEGSGGPPQGFRVYAARIAEYAEPSDVPVGPYALALHGDSRVVLDYAGEPGRTGAEDGRHAN